MTRAVAFSPTIRAWLFASIVAAINLSAFSAPVQAGGDGGNTSDTHDTNNTSSASNSSNSSNSKNSNSDDSSAGIASWFDPGKSPFIPIPEIDTDPNGGTTLGLFPTVLVTDNDHNIRQIIAPDILYNPYFGYGARGRIFAFPSNDGQWSITGGGKQRVEREFDLEYESGRERSERWSVAAQLIYDRSGTPRFYGIGNQTRANAETNYTVAQSIAGVKVGYNLTHAWQIDYTLQLKTFDVLPGALDHIASIEQRFATAEGIGNTHALLNRIALSYDTRDDLTVPTRGGALQIYAGAASRNGAPNDSLYSESGFDARYFWTPQIKTTLAFHAAIRWMPEADNAPFWSLSSAGGDTSEIGGAQLLRGFGEGRFRDRDAFSASAEIRRTVLSLDAFTTRVDIELAPFIDVARVFSSADTSIFSQLHRVGGLGFRAIAKPFVVGYVDVGYGSEGVAVFTGINYPF